MKKRILIAPNSFKECADSVEIANLILSNLSTIKEAECIIKPISDGGDGFLKVCQFHFGGEMISYSISTAFDDSMLECQVLFCANRKEIYIESAEVLGLKVVPLSYRNPMKLTSKGLGELLKKIEYDVQLNRIDVSRVFIGIGGTATTDMGMGMMSEIGLQIFDSKGEYLIVIPQNFHRAKVIDYSPVGFSFEIIPVADVNCTLLGSQGGIRVFGAQKNASEEMIATIEKGISHLLNLFENNSLSVSSNILSGAGGGIPAALQIFNKTGILHSLDFIKDYLGLSYYLNEIDYLITGEGAYDYQSEFGKGADVLLQLFKSHINKAFLICGLINSKSIPRLPENVVPIELNKYFSSDYESIINYKEGIHRACSDIVKQINF